MVQVLPYVESPLEQLTPYISQLAGTAGSAIGKIQEHRKVTGIMDKMQDPKTTPEERQKLEMDVTRMLAPQYLPFLIAGRSVLGGAPLTPSTGTPAQSDIGAEATEKPPAIQKLDADEARIMEQKRRYTGLLSNPLYEKAATAQLASLDKELDRLNTKRNIYLKQDVKTEAAQKERAQYERTINSQLNEMEDMLPYVGSWWGTKTVGGPVRRETVEKRAEFDTMGRDLFSVLKSLESKGVISKYIFQNMEKQMPDSEKSERENAGRIKGFRKLVNKLDPRIKDEIDKEMSAKFAKQKPPLAASQAETANMVEVYDPEGKLVGHVNKDQASQLPKGYTAK
jgi:hypothetical protein